MTGSPLTLYNSLTRAIEPFAPIDPANVRVYSCGPTVYNYAHIGNLRAYVFTDTLGRVLTWKAREQGWGRLTHVINITDVGHLTSDADAGDDKMEAAARARAMSIWDVAAHYTAAFKQNLRDLNIRDPQHFPLATDHIAEMIAFGEKIAPDHCYQLDSGLYFDVSTVPDYGRLARVSDDEREGRIDPVAGKRQPQDFAIWRTSGAHENRQMEWDSPWGRGAPGWHLECSVMSRKYLDPDGLGGFDIHTGGIDHREIHHPNEIAQNQAFCDCADTGARVWMHNNFLVERAGKMSKSSGDFTTLQTLIDRGFHPLAYRLMCLSAHYRSELEFSWENLAAAFTRLKRLVMAVETLKARDDGTQKGDAAPYRVRLDEAVSDDLGTPRALPVLDELLADKTLSPAVRLAALADFVDVLGLPLLTIARADLRVAPAGVAITPEQIAAHLTERKDARAAKDFARSDALRDDLAASGVEVMDGDALAWDWKPILA
jgi:cysteinyl-tRNA synthetase